MDLLRDAGAKGDAEIDVAETALVLAALDRPGCRFEGYRRHLADLTGDTATAARNAVALDDRVGAIREVIFDRHGYSGDTDTYDDMQNANLMSVIDRRKGLPVALGILCIHAARSQGWDMVGINFPSHFLVALRSRGESAVIDPFNAARILSQAALLRRLQELYGPAAGLDSGYCRPVADRDILLRLQNNIRLRALGDGNTDRAVSAMEAMVLLAPKQGDLRLEMAALQARSGKLKSAIRGLEEFLALPGEAQRRGDAAAFLRSLKGKLN